MRLDTRLLLSTPYIASLPLKGVFLNCRHLHVTRHPQSTPIEKDQHSEIEVQYVLEGKYLYQAEGELHQLYPGDGLVIVPGATHWSSNPEEGIRLSARVGTNDPHSEQFLAYLNNEPTGSFVPFPGADSALLVGELVKLALSDRPDIWQREMVGGLLQLWLGKVLTSCFDLTAWTQHSKSEQRFSGNRSAVLCERAASFIYDNFQRDIHIDDIAHHVGITARHLNRLFQQYLGNSVNTTLQDVRLTEAFIILNNTPTLPIKEVAYTVGFANPSYFTKCFKRKYNLLPKQMIQNLSATLDQALRHFIPAADRHLPFVSDATATDTDDKVIGPEEMDAK